MDEHWEPLSREMGLKSHSSYYGKDNPLIAMRDSMENLVAGGVLKLIDEHPERVEDILSEFMGDPNIEENANDFLHNAVETVMQVMNYEEIAKVIHENATYEDFNHDKFNNFRAMDFDKSYNHTRAKMKTVSLDEIQENINDGGDNTVQLVADSKVDVSAEVIANITKENFWNAISDDDKNLLQMRMDGMSQKEIATALGYQTHSAVTKRLQKLKNIFLEIA